MASSHKRISFPRTPARPCWAQQDVFSSHVDKELTSKDEPLSWRTTRAKKRIGENIWLRAINLSGFYRCCFLCVLSRICWYVYRSPIRFAFTGSTYGLGCTGYAFLSTFRNNCHTLKVFCLLSVQLKNNNAYIDRSVTFPPLRFAKKKNYLSPKSTFSWKSHVYV